MFLNLIQAGKSAYGFVKKIIRERSELKHLSKNRKIKQ